MIGPDAFHRFEGSTRSSSLLRRNALIIGGVAATALVTGCGGSEDPAPSTTTNSNDIVELAQATSDLSILVEAVVAAGLVDTLKGAGPFTVFAPNNAAFA